MDSGPPGHFWVRRRLPSARSIRPTRLCAANTDAYDIPRARAVSRNEQPSTAIRQKVCQVCGSTRCFHRVLDLLCLREQERTARLGRRVFRAVKHINGQQEFIGRLIVDKTDGLRSPLTKQVNRPGMAELPEPATKRPARIVLVRADSIRQLDPDLLAEVFEGAVVQAITSAPGTNQGIIASEEIAPCGMIGPVGDPLQKQRAGCNAVLPLHRAPQAEEFQSAPARR